MVVSWLPALMGGRIAKNVGEGRSSAHRFLVGEDYDKGVLTFDEVA